MFEIIPFLKREKEQNKVRLLYRKEVNTMKVS